MGILDFLIDHRLGKSGQYIGVNRHNFYYEIHGRGEPLMMFHGGMSCLETFRFQIPAFSKHFQCILPERRGHGHTADSPGAYTYKQMADDMVAFMSEMKIRVASMIGYSDGANLMMHMALNHPELIKKCVFIGGNFHHSGCDPVQQEELRRMPDDYIGEEGVDPRYIQYSPDGADHYAKVFAKVRKLWLTQPEFTLDEIRSISMPSLVIAGDHDTIRLDHTLTFANTLPDADVCILPNTTHRIIKERPEMINQLILDFLTKPRLKDVLP